MNDINLKIYITMKIKKQIVLFVAMLLLWTLAASAQSDQGRRHRFSPEEYVQKAKTYIIREAGLTPTEAAAFFPLYHKMKDQHILIMEKPHGNN